MKRLFLALVLLVPTLVGAQELVTLTTPVAKTQTTCRVSVISLDLDRLSVTATVTFNTGETAQKAYDAASTPTGATLLHNLNTGNFSVNSLMKAVYTRLATDNVCVGTVSGLPQ